MSEAAIATAEAAAPPPAAVEEIPVAPQPIRDEPHSEAEVKPEPGQAKEPPAEKKLTAREALEKAAAKVGKDEAAPKGEKSAETKTAAEKARDETGKFKAGEKLDADGKPIDPAKAVDAKATDKAAPHHQAPTRFSADAKAEWDKLPEPVKAETHRAIRELEQGHQKYKEAAANYEPFREFHALAKEVGADPAAALKEYVGIDRLLGQNFVAGLERIAANKGLDLKSVAREILGAEAGKPQQTAEGQTVAELRREIADLKRGLTGISGNLQQRDRASAETEALKHVEAFAQRADKPHFAELSDAIAQHIANDGLSLEDAYDRAFETAQSLAASLGFIPKPANTGPSAADLEAQTQKGQKSIAGAPSAGSAPAAHKPSSSIRDALRRAIQSQAV